MGKLILVAFLVVAFGTIGYYVGRMFITIINRLVVKLLKQRSKNGGSIAQAICDIAGIKFVPGKKNSGKIKMGFQLEDEA